MPWDPHGEQTFGEYMRGEDGRTADVVTGDRTWATRDQAEEGRTDDGVKYRSVVDQAGNRVTETTAPDGTQRRHVRINLR